jgi:aromatic ring-opening dioxygenase LigB subunit
MLQPKTSGVVVRIPPSKKLLACSGTSHTAVTRLAARKDDPHAHVSFSPHEVLLYSQLAVVFDMPQRRGSYTVQQL